jgi:ParB/RepB/Spo0J family partition protein
MAKAKQAKKGSTKSMAEAMSAEGAPSPRVHTQQTVPYGAIKLGRNARRNIGNVDELVASIKEQGFISAVTVTRDPTPQGFIDENGETVIPPQTYTLTAGYRRHKALGIIGVSADWPVPAIILNTETEAADVASVNIIENLQREDLHPYDMMCAFRELLEEHDLSGHAIARRVGKSSGYVNNLLRAGRDLHPDILARWAEYDPAVSPRVAIELSALPQDEQLKRWAVISGKLNEYAHAVEGTEGEDDEGGGSKKKTKPKKQTNKLGRPLPTVQLELIEHMARGNVKLPPAVAKYPKNVQTAYLLGVNSALQWTSGSLPDMPVIAKLSEVKRGRPAAKARGKGGRKS